MTLQELLNQIPEAKKTERVPSYVMLSAEAIPVIRDVMDEETSAIIYSNGYVVFWQGSHATVFRLHDCRDYVYHTVDESVTIPFSEFADQPWQVRVYMEGKDRLVHNQNNSGAGRTLSIDADQGDTWRTELSDREQNDPLFLLIEQEQEEEENKTLLDGWSKLTERQREILTLCVVNGKTRAEAAADLGMTSQAVTDAVRHALRQMRKQFGLSGDYERRQYFARWEK